MIIGGPRLSRGRSIAWLRADPEGLRVLREAREILAPQGIRLFQPHGLDAVVADVSVEPLPGTPEWLLYQGVPQRVSYKISERDPWRALARALTVPRSGFARVAVGIDPGSTCAVAIVADGILLRAWKAPCHTVGRELTGLLARLPSSRLDIAVGSGPGMPEASLSLGEAGLEYIVADESWTTSRPALWAPLERLRDRDIKASATIALRLASPGREPNT